MDQHVARWTLGTVALIGLAAAGIAGATVWLLITDPVAVSTATSTANVGLFARDIGIVIFSALQGLLRYL
jgi:hypothetical protein